MKNRVRGAIFASICVLTAAGSASADSIVQSRGQSLDYSCRAGRGFGETQQFMLASSESGTGSVAQLFALLGDSTSALISKHGGPSFIMPEFGAQSGPFATPSYEWWDTYYDLASYSEQYLSSLHLCETDTAALSPLFGLIRTNTTDVPEPGSWILMLTGVALLGLLLRSRPGLLVKSDCAPASMGSGGNA